MMRITVRDGLITDRTDYWDSKSFLLQAGLEA
jgi:ketosteroid isomerase-like protein